MIKVHDAMPKERVLVFFVSKSSESGGTAVPVEDQGYVYVRVEEVNKSLSDALDTPPRDGENLLNSQSMKI